MVTIKIKINKKSASLISYYYTGLVYFILLKSIDSFHVDYIFKLL